MSTTDAQANIYAAIAKLDLLRKEFDIPDTNHSWSKARMFLRDAVEDIARDNARRGVTNEHGKHLDESR